MLKKNLLTVWNLVRMRLPLLAVFGLAACASSNTTPVFDRLSVTSAESQIVIVRESNDSREFSGPVSIFVGGMFHTALLSGGYTQIRACADKATVVEGIRGLPQDRQSSNTAGGNSITPKKNQTLLFKLGAADLKGRVSLVPLPADELNKWAVNRQSHLVSRVPPAACN